MATLVLQMGMALRPSATSLLSVEALIVMVLEFFCMPKAGALQNDTSGRYRDEKAPSNKLNLIQLVCKYMLMSCAATCARST